ncbi:hypothetical protein [Yersinia thracica]|uniref:hypothetical protein n=1 Tax=Yersinia thracica TaxID=2890319 RepID=UPI00157BBAE1|nr:hypothetical protein [Yersinia thracica]
MTKLSRNRSAAVFPGVATGCFSLNPNDPEEIFYARYCKNFFRINSPTSLAVHGLTALSTHMKITPSLLFDHHGIQRRSF